MLLQHRAIIHDEGEDEYSWINLACPQISDLNWTIQSGEDFRNNKKQNVFLHLFLPLLHLITSKDEAINFLSSFRVGAIIGIASPAEKEIDGGNPDQYVLVAIPNKNKCIARMHLIKIHPSMTLWMLASANLMSAIHFKYIKAADSSRYKLFLLETSLFSFTVENSSFDKLQKWWSEDSSSEIKVSTIIHVVKCLHNFLFSILYQLPQKDQQSLLALLNKLNFRLHQLAAHSYCKLLNPRPVQFQTKMIT
jgi:hypothetical protein